MKQMLPLKLSAREDASQKAKRSVSPHQQQQTQLHPLHHHHTGTTAPHPLTCTY